MGRRMSGVQALNLFCDALGITETDVSRLVIEIDVNDIPKVYLTRVPDADKVLRVVELVGGKGQAVEADPSAVEIVPLVIGGEG